MTPFENFHRMMGGDRPQWLPLAMPCTPPIIDLIEKHTGTRDVVQAFNLDMGEVGAGASGDPAEWRKALEKLGYQIPERAVLDGLGWGWVPGDPASVGAAYHFREELHPLAVVESIDQLQALPWPEVDDPKYFAHLPDRVKQIHDTGLFVVGGMECTNFETAWYRRGMDNLYMDLIEGNGISDWLLDYFTERSCASGRAYVRAGCDVVGLGDDVGTQRGMMVSPEFWREHLQPRLKRVIDAIRQTAKELNRTVYIRYHSDGDIRAILGDLFEMGVDILNPLQPECMPVREVIEQYKHEAFWGAIGTQTTMPFGTPDDVRAAVAELLELGRAGAKIVVSPTHVMEPEVPWANIEALANAERRL